jgi:hypothetical protein
VERDKVTNALVLHWASTQCEPFGVDKYQEFHWTSGDFLATLKANLHFVCTEVDQLDYDISGLCLFMFCVQNFVA